MRPMSWLRYYADVCCPEDREYYRIVWEPEKRLATKAPFHCALVIRSKELYCE
jgi:hypothetical protein